jgi:hypothetical protein
MAGEQIAMEAPLAAVNPQIAMASTQPNPDIARNFQLPAKVDIEGGQAHAAEAMQRTGEAKAKTNLLQEDETDRMIIKQIKQVDPDANTSTVEGMKKLLGHAKGSGLSDTAITRINKALGDKTTADLDYKNVLMKGSLETLDLGHKEVQWTNENLVRPMVEARRSKYAETQDDKQADLAFETAKSASIELAAQLKNPDGTPKFTDAHIAKMKAATYDEVAHNYNVTDVAAQHMKEALANKQAQAKIELEQAQAMAASGRAERELAQAEKLSRDEGGGKPELKTLNVDGKPASVNYKGGKIFGLDGKEIAPERVTPVEGRSSSLITGRYNPRTISAAKDVLNALHTINESPFQTEGIFGSNKHSDSILGDVSKYASKVLTTDSAQRFSTVQLDLNRALGITLEMGGKTSEAESKQLSGYSIAAGDTVGAAQMKIAGSAQVVRNALESMETTNLPASQRKEVDKLLDELKQFPTQRELQAKYYEGAKKPALGITPAKKAEGGTYEQPIAAALGPVESHDNLPDPSKYTGKIATDEDTKEQFKSDGKKWVPIPGAKKAKPTQGTADSIESIRSAFIKGDISEDEAHSRLVALNTEAGKGTA